MRRTLPSLLPAAPSLLNSLCTTPPGLASPCLILHHPASPKLAVPRPACPHPCLPLPQWHAAIHYVRSAALADVLADFDGIDATVMDILQRYQVGA